jgi:hypothetical protein
MEDKMDTLSDDTAKTSNIDALGVRSEQRPHGLPDIYFNAAEKQESTFGTEAQDTNSLPPEDSRRILGTKAAEADLTGQPTTSQASSLSLVTTQASAAPLAGAHEVVTTPEPHNDLGANLGTEGYLRSTPNSSTLVEALNGNNRKAAPTVSGSTSNSGPSYRYRPFQSTLDQPIRLKNNASRLHVHRYDLSILIKRKPKSDDEEESLIQQALQRFFKIMLAADPTFIIPAFLCMDRNDRSYPDLCSEYQVSMIEEFSSLKRYFSRLGNRNETTGKVYCSLILAQSITFSAIIHTALSALRTDSLGLYPSVKILDP